MDELIDYCNLALDEVSAENCVECQNWDFCEYVTATVIPDLLEGLVDYLENDLEEASDAYGDEQVKAEVREWVDTVRNVVARLKGEHYVSANDV